MTETHILYAWFGNYIALPIPLARKILASNVDLEKVIRFGNYQQYGILKSSSHFSLLQHINP